MPCTPLSHLSGTALHCQQHLNDWPCVQFPGKVDPKQVPSSLLGVKQVRATATMGPGSGGVLVDPSHFLLKHEGEPELPPREQRHPACSVGSLRCGVPRVAEFLLAGRAPTWF